MTKRIFIYARRSDKRKKGTSVSIDDQVKKIKAEAKKKGFIIDKVIEENKSGFNAGKRDDFNDMIRELINRNVKGKGKFIDFVFIKMPSRISRNDEDTKVIIDLLNKEIVGLYSLSDGETSSLMSMQKLEKDLIDAKYESKVKSIEGSVYMDEATKNNGTVCITPPYGYKNVGSKSYSKVVHNNDNSEANIVKEIFEEYSTLKYSINSLVEHLNLKYKKTRLVKGKVLFSSFTYDNVYNILKYEKYCGIYKHTYKISGRNKRKHFEDNYPEIEIVKDQITIDYTNIIKDFGTFEPIVSKYLFNICQKIKGPTKSKKKNDKKDDYIFKGTLRCDCKKDIENNRYKWLQFTGGKAKKIYDFYKCSNNNAKTLKCNNLGISGKKVEELFIKTFIDGISFSKLEIEIFENIISKQLEDITDGKEDTSKTLGNKLKTIKSQESKILDSYMVEENDKIKKSIGEKLKNIQKDIELTEEELEKISKIDTKHNIQKRQIEDYIFYISSLGTKFKNFPKFRKKELVEAMFEYVVLVNQEVAEYKLNPVFELAFNKKKFDVLLNNSKKKLNNTSNSKHDFNKGKEAVGNFKNTYGIPDKDRTCVYPLGGGYSSTELQRLKKFLNHIHF